MRRIIAGGLILAAVAGCREAGPDQTPAAAAAGHNRTVAGLQGSYIWDCTLDTETGARPWRFVLQRQGTGSRADIYVLQPDSGVTRKVEQVQKNGAARIYHLHDGSRILIASDGEVRGEGDGGSRGADYTTGRCGKGGQPV